MNKEKQSFSPKNRRMERERNQRRKSIIDIAERFFLEQGYERTMIDQIALEAGYSKATIYNYFESKDDLFIAVISKAYEKLFQTMETTFTESGKKQELRTMGDAYLIYVDKYPDYASLFDAGRLSLGIKKILQKEETSQSLTESEEEFRFYQLKIEKLMISVITETMNAAGVQESVDPLSVVMALSALNSAIQELIMRGKRTNHPEGKSKEYLNVLFTIIDKGLKHYDD
ncbi:MAG: TetR/AcrR family transcriptional regulator [Candidatus Hodarchaeales archaeon]|jgi:AcrR family transcriptional regulator